MSIKFKIKGVTCPHCAGLVKTALFRLEGIENVELDISKAEMQLIMDKPLPFSLLKDAVENAGPYGITEFPS